MTDKGKRAERFFEVVMDATWLLPDRVASSPPPGSDSPDHRSATSDFGVRFPADPAPGQGRAACITCGPRIVEVLPFASATRLDLAMRLRSRRISTGRRTSTAWLLLSC